ncbi:hypothetical protein BCY86_04225 [Pajaroellobacter abortibovis]|uniref:4Fe-4S ferredoxin-type domain-containing protein n=1 Tax=Pajaroellobacter abortibovis TaxID=1882918 RepID=A0A1L6MWR1_9BACT|nr:hypothetical protein BCY86_04225 [Pajaroellobacter abortibovis]
MAYLTIEYCSEIDLKLREVVGEHLFGCDDCQLVCPFNASPSLSSLIELRTLSKMGAHLSR